MPTNKEWLFSLPLDEQLAWMNAEHFECPSDAGEAAIMSVDAFIAEHANETEHVQKLDELDSREKLEVDTRKLMRKLYEVGYTDARFNAGIIGEADIRPPSFDFDENRGAKFFALLDRQAKITERQYEERVTSIEQQVDNLAHDLAESERLREEMREELSVAYDHAHDLLARRDRGLA